MLNVSARERGVLLSDGAISCSAGINTTTPAEIPKSTPSYEEAHALNPGADKGQCIIDFFGTNINTASFAMYTFSISVLLQALLIISMSGAADHGRYRKSLLLSFAFTGAVATMLFLAISPKIYAYGALLAIISNTCFGASFVLLNSYLPVLVRRHPSIQATELDRNNFSHGSSLDQTEEEQGHESVTESLLQPSPVNQHMIPSSYSSVAVSPALRLSTKISSHGIGIGYIAAVIVQALGIAIVLVADSENISTTMTLRIVLFLVGLWWFVFTIPAALWLRIRPGPPLPSISKGSRWAGYIGYAWRSLGKTILRVRHLRDVMFFLGAWLLLSDAIATVSGTAVLFAKTELHMTPAALALISLVGTVAGILGAFSWSQLVRMLPCGFFLFRFWPVLEMEDALCGFSEIQRLSVSPPGS